MKILFRFSNCFIALLLVCGCFAQTPFSNCSAAFLNNKIIVDTYSPDGKCVLDTLSQGELTVCTANLSPSESIAVDKIKFKIAIRDQNTKTITMYSDETFTKVSIQKVLNKTKRGDHIVLITMNNEYALPHNEILIK